MFLQVRLRLEALLILQVVEGVRFSTFSTGPVGLCKTVQSVDGHEIWC